MNRMKPCWSCGAVDEACSDGCMCAKCVNPDGYDEWRRNNQYSYAIWMSENVLDRDESTRWFEHAQDLEDWG